LPFRCARYRRTEKKLRGFESHRTAFYALPWREFFADLVAWLIAGLFMAGLYVAYFQAPFLTAIKILLGCLFFGLFGGMIQFLATEKKTISLLKIMGFEGTFPQEKMLSVGSKMLFFMVTILLFMVTVILLMVFMDINFLLTNKDSFGPDIYIGVFKEILFAFGVILALSLILLARYTQNLRSILSIQLDVMENISRGNYDSKVPVVSNDEFGLIAAKTNHMALGLKERDLCQISFGKYVTPEISEKILKGEISPEGELSEATILFCDLRGYTPFVARKDPKDVVKFLNEYFSEMETAVRQSKGIVLQYIGDEIEAVFGAPIPVPKHPEMAVKAAIEMRKRLEILNQKRRAKGEEPIRHGIGIHTGTVLAGSVGSPERLVYAMVGDTVNVASRIQDLNKQFGTDILISVTTENLIKDGSFATVSLGKTPIKGKSEEIEVFKVT